MREDCQFPKTEILPVRQYMPGMSPIYSKGTSPFGCFRAEYINDYLVFGPYESFKSGKYNIEINIDVLEIKGNSQAIFDVFSDSEVVFRRDFPINETGRSILQFEFEIPVNSWITEFRILVLDLYVVEFHGYTVRLDDVVPDDVCADSDTSMALCFINKNEGRYALRMLEELIHGIDYVLMLDTLSDDDSVQVVEDFLSGRECRFSILSSQFNGDFSEIRNLAIQGVPDDISYILFIDCDELISLKELQYIKDFILISGGAYDSYALPRLNFQKDGSIAPYPDYQRRVFKNNKKIRYSGKIHETLINFNVIKYFPPYWVDAASPHIKHYKNIMKSDSDLHDRNITYLQISQ